MGVYEAKQIIIGVEGDTWVVGNISIVMFLVMISFTQ